MMTAEFLIPKVILDIKTQFNPKKVTTLLQDMYMASISEETGMTIEEIAFKKFESLYRYDWYAQPDGGDKTVIFSYYPKGMYSLEKGDYVQPIKFEAKSLEEAFEYALFKCGITKLFVGKVTDFNVAKWSTIHPVTRYFSIGEQKWKKMPEYEVAV